jgi:hypothetical protein
MSEQDTVTLRKPDPNYPKAFYKLSDRGDLVSPAYERIVVSESGQAQRVADRRPYTTALAKDLKEEKELLKDGWTDTAPKTEAA